MGLIEERISSGRQEQQRTRRPYGLPALAVVALATLTALTVPVAPAGAADPERSRLDRREGERARVPADVRRARRELRRDLGRFAALSTDPQTGAVRSLARLDGHLTPSSGRDPGTIARAYAREHADALGLDAPDVDALRLARRRTAPGGLQQLVFEQHRDGIPAVDSSLRATVTPDGRLLSLGGGPRDLPAVPGAPAVGAPEAYRAAAASAGVAGDPVGADQAPGPTRRTTFANGDSAELVLYEDGAAIRLGWRVVVQPSSTEYYDAIVDARTGAVQRRFNRVRFATARLFQSFPGAPRVAPDAPDGGVQTVLDISPWLEPGATSLRGDNAHAFLDRADAVRGNPQATQPPAGDETAPTAGGNFDYPVQGFDIGAANCPATPPRCTWHPRQPFSWEANSDQDATQLFYYVNRFHDHLESAPGIGFDEASGNFERGDRVVAQAMDGAATGNGLPDALHHSNANMLTLPDGQPGFMQMYLFDPEQNPRSRGVSVANDATVVYHEYAHGLVHRLVTDAQGFGAVNTAQAGALDEALADWYALDFLVAERLLPDDPGAADVELGTYPDVGGLRTRPIDCLPAGGCGYTYADFGGVAGGPEIHSDGEIWGQTMWQLRAALVQRYGAASGISRARARITTALRLSAENPSFLDMRNAILLADTQAGGLDRDLLWSVFAARGMGYFASSAGSDDTTPIADFSTPPDPAARTASVRGAVFEEGGGPVAGALVAFSGHDSGLGEDLSATTGADGGYAIAGVVPRTYPYLVARGPGGLVEIRRANLAVPAGVNRQDFLLRRNLAAAAAGGSVVSVTGLDNTAFGCGPGGLIDGGRAVWGTESPRNVPGGAKEIVVRLAAPIALGAVEIDPSAGCGDPPGSALGPFTVQVSGAQAGPYTTVAGGTFRAGDVGRLNPIALSSTPGGVQFVKLIAHDTQAGSQAGDNGFMDVAELAVFAAGGAPPPPAPPGAPPAAPPAAPPSRGSARGDTSSTTVSGRLRAAVSCRATRTRRRVTVSCRLRDRRGARSASLRLSRRGRTVDRARGRVRSGRLPALRFNRRSRRLTYRLTVTVRRTTGRPRTIRRSIRL